MNAKYIKLNNDNRIIDVFYPRQTTKFDGTEIFLDETEKIDHKINGKSISDEYGNFIFEYDVKKQKITENDIYADDRATKKAKDEKENKINSFNISAVISDLVDQNKFSMANLEIEIKKYFEG